MKFNATTAAAILALALSAPATGAFAQTGTAATGGTEMMAASTVKISTTEAVASVEAASSGKVVELSLDMESGTPSYRVTALAKDGTETNYLVDAITGTATVSAEAKSSADAADQSEGSDEGQDSASETEDAD